MPTLLMNSLTAASPYNTPPAGWTRPAWSQTTQVTLSGGANHFQRLSGTGLQAGAWLNTTPITSNTIFASTVHGANATQAGNDSARLCIVNSSGNGYSLWLNQAGTTARIYTVVAGTLTTQLVEFTSYGTGYSQTFEIRCTNKSTGTFKFLRNGVQVGSDLIDTTYTGLEYAGCASTGGRVTGMIVDSIFDILTLTNPVIPNSSFSGTSSGAVDGAGTLSHGGVSTSITFAGGGTTYSGTWPLPVDTQVYPYLPVVSGTFTISQGGSSDTIVSNLSAPAGMNAVTFGTIITDDPYYLGAQIVVEGITVADVRRCYYPNTLSILPDSRVDVLSGSLPRTEQIILHMANGNTYYHDLDLSVDGAVVDDTTPDSFTFTAVTNATLNTTYTSNEVTISGLGSGINADLTIVDGLYSKNGGSYVSTAGTITNGDTLRVRRNSSSSYGTAVDLDVTVGTYTTQYSITTTADTEPDTVKFVTLSALSDIKTITGLAGTTPISIVGGQYSKNGGSFTGTSGTLVNNDTIQLSGANGATVKVTIGTKIFSWSSKGGGGGFGGSIGIGI